MMVTRKQRIDYARAVGIAFAVGAILAVSGVAADMPIYVLFVAPFSFGGILSGFILLIRQLRLSPVSVKVLVWVLFPVTLLVVFVCGTVTLLPYYIYNLVYIRKTKKEVFPGQPLPPPSYRSKKKTVLLIIVAFYVVFLLASQIYQTIRDAGIAKDIYEKTGYTPESLDNIIIAEFYYRPYDPDYARSLDYSYDIKDGTLFILNEDNWRHRIKFPNLFGKYSQGDNAQRSEYLYGTRIRPDLDQLFTGCSLARQGNTYAYMLTLDATGKDQLAKELFNDFTFAQPGKLELYDETGGEITSKAMDNGRYVIYYDVIYTDDTEYTVTASYRGESYTLLTYDDIIKFKLGRNS
jgi:hypothetical protein